MHFELEFLGQLITGFHGVVAGPFATGLTTAAGGAAHGRTGTADVPTFLGHGLEARLQIVGNGAQEDEVAGGAMHIEDATAILIPNVKYFPQGGGGIKPAGGRVDPYGVEMCQTGEFIRQVGVTADDAGAITQHTHDAAVFPVGDFFFIGSFQLPQQVVYLRLRRGQPLQILHEARERTGYKLIQ